MKKEIKRLEYLAGMLSKYQHVWWKAAETGKEPSVRMYSWVDEYNEIKEKLPYSEWAEWCEKTGSDPSHDALDYFA